MNPDVLPECFTWEWFRAWLAKYAPEVPADSIPEDGGWDEAHDVVATHYLQARVFQWVCTVPGNRAVALYWAALEKVIDVSPSELLTLLLDAPGDRALAVYCAVRDHLIDLAPGELRPILANAPGNQAWAIYMAMRDRLLQVSPAELLSLLTQASGERADVLYFAARDKDIEVTPTQLRALLLEAPGNREWAMSAAIQHGLIPPETGDES